MSCDCSKAKDLPTCIDLLQIGDIDGTPEVYVVFKTPDGRLDIYEGQYVAYTGLLGVASPKLRSGTQYEIWVTDIAAGNINERLPFTPDGETETVTCVYAEFSPCFDADFKEFTEQTFTLK